MKLFVLPAFILLLFATSCDRHKKASDGNTIIKGLTDYIGSNYTITREQKKLSVSIDNSEVISNERNRGGDFFTYEQYASLSALLVMENEQDSTIKQIEIIITDSNNVNQYSYYTDDIVCIGKNLNNVIQFCDAIIEEDFDKTLPYYSDSVKRLPLSIIKQKYYNPYFSYGDFTDYKLISFKIFDNKYISYIITLTHSDKRKQSYMLYYLLDDPQGIEFINFLK